MFLCGNNRQFIIGNNDDCVFTTNVGQKNYYEINTDCQKLHWGKANIVLHITTITWYLFLSYLLANGLRKSFVELVFSLKSKKGIYLLL